MTMSTESLAREACDRVSAAGPTRTWQQRIVALMLVLQRSTCTPVELVPVRAAIYSRSALFRLGGCALPTSEGEMEQFHEQVGSAMVLLGTERPHAIVLVGSVMIELADAREWNDRGALLRPFVSDRPQTLDRWTVQGLRYGVSIAYEHDPEAVLPSTTDLAAHRLARDVLCEMRPDLQQRA